MMMLCGMAPTRTFIAAHRGSPGDNHDSAVIGRKKKRNDRGAIKDERTVRTSINYFITWVEHVRYDNSRCGVVAGNV